MLPAIMILDVLHFCIVKLYKKYNVAVYVVCSIIVRLSLSLICISLSQVMTGNDHF